MIGKDARCWSFPCMCEHGHTFLPTPYVHKIDISHTHEKNKETWNVFQKFCTWTSCFRTSTWQDIIPIIIESKSKNKNKLNQSTKQTKEQDIKYIEHDLFCKIQNQAIAENGSHKHNAVWHSTEKIWGWLAGCVFFSCALLWVSIWTNESWGGFLLLAMLSIKKDLALFFVSICFSEWSFRKANALIFFLCSAPWNVLMNTQKYTCPIDHFIVFGCRICPVSFVCVMTA